MQRSAVRSIEWLDGGVITSLVLCPPAAHFSIRIYQLLDRLTLWVSMVVGLELACIVIEDQIRILDSPATVNSRRWLKAAASTCPRVVGVNRRHHSAADGRGQPLADDFLFSGRKERETDGVTNRLCCEYGKCGDQ